MVVLVVLAVMAVMVVGGQVGFCSQGMAQLLAESGATAFLRSSATLPISACSLFTGFALLAMCTLCMLLSLKLTVLALLAQLLAGATAFLRPSIVTTLAVFTLCMSYLMDPFKLSVPSGCVRTLHGIFNGSF